VRTPDGVMVESRNAIILKEGDYPEVVYFPREDVAMALLEPSDTTSRCPFKGDASYFHYVGQSERINDVAWSYEAPDQDAAKPIAGYLAFYGDKVTVEQL
jgi:uncharacterized protein (DUF427 family)